jgi:hypothetical protein
MKSLKSLFARLAFIGVAASLTALSQGGAGAASGLSTNPPALVSPTGPLTAPPLAPEPAVGLTSPVGVGFSATDTNVAGATLEPQQKSHAKPAAPKLPGVGVKGAIKAVDTKALSFTVAAKGKSPEHVVHVSSSSRYTRNGKPATVADIAVDDAFNGRVKKNKQGQEVLLSGSFSSGKTPENHGEKSAAKSSEKK